MKYTNLHVRLHRLFVAAGILLGAAGVPAHAAHPGDPDGSFGNGSGYLFNDFFGTDEQIYAVAPMRDGRFIAAGVVTAVNASGSGSSQNIAIARYLPNGTLDDSFGSAGLFHLDVDGGTDDARAVKVYSDGSVLVAGSLTTDAHADFGLVKLQPDGSLDTTFGELDAGTARKGWVRLDIAGVNFHDQAYALATQKDGRIIVAGVTPVQHGNFHYNQVAVARFTVNGELDTSFAGGAGCIVLASFFGDAADVLTGIALTQDGSLPADDRITVVGYSFGVSTAFVARLTANGAVDATFGSGSGRITIQPGSSGGVPTGVSTLVAARLTKDGHILTLGEGGDRGLTVMRYSSTGALDTTFNGTGRATIKFSASSDYDEPAALALQGNGKIVAAGYATNRVTGAPRKDFFVARLLANGAADTGFGDSQGRAVVQVASEDDEAFAAGVEASGNLLIGGYQQRLGVNGRDFALLRVFGDPDRIFANGFDGPGFD